MIEIRPDWCPRPLTCTCFQHSSDDAKRLCWGRMAEKKYDEEFKIWNTHRHCEDGTEIEYINSADCLYFVEGYLACLLDVLKTPELYDPLPELGVTNPIGMLERRLKGE